MRILYSGTIDGAHSKNGGYQHILDNPLTQGVLLASNCLFGNVSKKFRLRKITYFLLDMKTRWARRHYDITHLFYADLTMSPLFPYKKRRNNKIVGTIHLDLEKQRFGKAYINNLKSFDGVIVLSSQQKEYYKNKFNIDTVFIPHGLDKPSFSFEKSLDIHGNEIDKDKINLITLGKNYRDFKTLEEAIIHFQNTPEIHFHIVGAPTMIKERLKDYTNVSIYNRLNDNQYYSLIEECDYSFLPLTFATANNALLEVQSLGRKSILPNLPGVLDYSAPSPLNIMYNSMDELFGIIGSLTKSGYVKEIEEYAKRFRWENIYKELNQFYSEL